MAGGHTVERVQRWSVPFSSEMTEGDVERLLQREPFRSMDPQRFPANVPLAGILKNDTRLVRTRRGDLLIREGDYGSSAFLILEGAVQVTIDPLPPALLGRASARRSWWRQIAKLWSGANHPESRHPALKGRTGVGAREGSGGARVFLQDVPRILERHRTVRLEAGELFGELAALGRTPRTATVFADDEALLLEIRWQGLRDLRKSAPEFKQFIDARYRDRALKTHLSESEIFAGLAPDALDRIAAATEFETHGAFDWYGAYKSVRARGGEAAEPRIAEEGHYPNGLILVRAGFARLSKRLGVAQDTIGYLGKGGAFGLEELIVGWRSGGATPLRSTLSALGYVDILRIPTSVIENELLEAMPTKQIERFATAPAEPKLPDSMLDFLVENRYVNGSATMLIDMTRCTRCDDCVRACSSAHDNNPRFVRHGPRHGDFMVATACMHCRDPVCMIGCPTGAIHRSVSGGAVVINDLTCVGCGTCAASCPYDAIRMVEARSPSGQALADSQSGLPIMKATKCDLCVELHGGPCCERACPHGALRRVDMMQLERLARWTER